MAGDIALQRNERYQVAWLKVEERRKREGSHAAQITLPTSLPAHQDRHPHNIYLRTFLLESKTAQALIQADRQDERLDLDGFSLWSAYGAYLYFQVIVFNAVFPAFAKAYIFISILSYFAMIIFYYKKIF